MSGSPGTIVRTSLTGARRGGSRMSNYRWKVERSSQVFLARTTASSVGNEVPVFSGESRFDPALFAAGLKRRPSNQIVT